MAATLFLEFGKIEHGDVPLALAVADSERGDGPDGESFGLDDAGAEDLKACRAWGIWVKESLSGAVWVDETAPGTARVRALAIGKGWRCTGLLAWMLSELARTLRREGFRNIAVDIFHGGPRLGEGLEEAGFSGPSPDDESYPTGAWAYRGG